MRNKLILFGALIFICAILFTMSNNSNNVVAQNTNQPMANAQTPNNPLMAVDSLNAGDTTAVFNVWGAHKVVVTISDSSNSLTDSIRILTRNGIGSRAYWSNVTAHATDQTTMTTNVSGILPAQEGLVRSYEITSDGVFTEIMVVRTNGNGALTYAPETDIAVKWY